MTILEVGNLGSYTFHKRNFYDLEFRQKTEAIIREFAKNFNILIFDLLWKNFGQEDDLHEMGVALVVNKLYELRYLLVAEDFQLWYRDSVNPRAITELEDSDSLQDIIKELFHNMLSDHAKRQAFIYFDTIEARGDFPEYPDEPKYKKQPINEQVLAHMRNMDKL